MARISDVVSSSRDTSPDPITLPSSPLGSRSPRNTRSSTKLSPRKPVTRASATPMKSVMVNTPQAGVESPWRIKVTVEAEPRDGSPAKRMTRTTTVPLKMSASKKRSSSPIKRSDSQQASDRDVKRPVRKRKGTPIRDKRPARSFPAQQDKPVSEQDDFMPAPSHTPARRASGRLARLHSYNNSTRSKRLSAAREELDYALQDAAGRPSSAAKRATPGDRTVSLNEDFSIISVDSLQTAKEASLSNVMQTIPEMEKSTASIPRDHQSSPKVHYPDIEHVAVEATSNEPYQYDHMSWKPTGPADEILPRNFRSSAKAAANTEQKWQVERDDVIQQAESAAPSNVFLVEDGPDSDSDAAEEDNRDGAIEDEDIWQDEASRSLQTDRQQGNLRASGRSDVHHPTRSPQLEDLFAGQPPRPARPKIPRTWRRSSGMDFSYVDSPAHEPAAQHIEGRPHSTDGSGVLTPPSTDEEAEAEEFEGEGEGEDEYADAEEHDEAESEFQPDAEATRFQDHEVNAEEDAFRPEEEDEVGTPSSDASSSPDDDDTGNFFSHNMPQVYLKDRPRRRPPQQKTMDLTELLNLDAVNSPAKAHVSTPRTGRGVNTQRYSNSSSAQKRSSPLHKRAVEERLRSNETHPIESKAISSPLRKSLLRSSKVHDSPQVVIELNRATSRFPRDVAPGRFRPRQVQLSEEDILDSFESKASDQRQLLQEATASRQQRLSRAHIEDGQVTGTNASADMDQSGHNYEETYEYEEEIDEPIRSYEENLNKESPGKVRVNFNDSRTHSSLLDITNRKQYPPLFGPAPGQARTSKPVQGVETLDMITLVDKKRAPQPGLLTRLSTTFWSAVVRPTGPTEVIPPPAARVYFPPDLRAQLRQRYGVVSEDFPWTMCHIRILHRMLNSQSSGRLDSIIPRSGPLPAYLTKRSNAWQTSITGYRWLFTKAQAYVVWSFFQVLVPQHLIESMERGEVEWLGDTLAQQCRQYYGDRHGSEPVWVPEIHNQEVCQWVDGMEGKIDLEFVMRALGTAVDSNEQLKAGGRGQDEDD